MYKKSVAVGSLDGSPAVIFGSWIAVACDSPQLFQQIKEESLKRPRRSLVKKYDPE